MRDDAYKHGTGTRPAAASCSLFPVPCSLLLLFLLFLAAPVGAQLQVPPMTPEQTQAANEAMARLRSPVTSFHTVDMCPSTEALRDTIRVAAAGGMSRDEIVEDVVARYGERVRLLPKREGVGLVAWVATPLFLLLGAGLLVGWVRRRSPAQDAAAPLPSSGLSEAERAEVAAALREWDAEEEARG